MKIGWLTQKNILKQTRILLPDNFPEGISSDTKFIDVVLTEGKTNKRKFLNLGEVIDIDYFDSEIDQDKVLC
jgi:hypothetical protein